MLRFQCGIVTKLGNKFDFFFKICFLKSYALLNYSISFHIMDSTNQFDALTKKT